MTDATTDASVECELHLYSIDRGLLRLRCACGFEREFMTPVGFGPVGFYATKHMQEMRRG